MAGGEIPGFRTIRRQVVKLPRPGMVGYELPVTDANGAIAIVIPPEIVVSDRAILREGGHETFARRWHRRWWTDNDRRPLASSQLENGRCQINDVARSVAQLAVCRNALRPIND